MQTKLQFLLHFFFAKGMQEGKVQWKRGREREIGEREKQSKYNCKNMYIVEKQSSIKK